MTSTMKNYIADSEVPLYKRSEFKKKSKSGGNLTWCHKQLYGRLAPEFLNLAGMLIFINFGDSFDRNMEQEIRTEILETNFIL